eukprot:Nk52_evm19s1737 gene=Nk52_evmTU19s1737
MIAGSTKAQALVLILVVFLAGLFGAAFGDVQFQRMELVNAASNLKVRDLVNGSVIENKDDWNIFAIPVDIQAYSSEQFSVRSARFFVNEVLSKNESSFPYTLCGDFSGTLILTCNKTDFPDGAYEVVAFPFATDEFLDKNEDGFAKVKFDLKSDISESPNSVQSFVLKDEVNSIEETVAADGSSTFEYKNNTVLNVYVEFERPVASVRFSYDLGGATKFVVSNVPADESGYKKNSLFSLCDPTANSCLPLDITTVEVTVQAFTEWDSSGFGFGESKYSFSLEAERQFSFKKWVLTNAETDTDVRDLSNGDTIERADFPKGAFNAHIVTEPERVGSMLMKFDGEKTFLENNPPYAMCSDSNRDFQPCFFPDGKHTLTAIAFSERGGNGTVLGQNEIVVNIVTKEQVNGAFNFVLLDNELNDPVEITKTDSSDPYRFIDLSKYPNGYTIQSTVVPDDPGSVRFFVNDVEFGVDNTPPFTLCGKDDHFKDGFLDCNFPVGVTKIKSVPFSKGNGNGFELPSREISIQVTQQFSFKTWVLANAETDKDVRDLSNGDTIERADFPKGAFNAHIVTDPERVGSMLMKFDGEKTVLENGPPYAICSDSNRDFNSCYFPDGQHTFSAIAYSERDGNGTVLGQSDLIVNIVTKEQVNGAFNFVLLDNELNNPIEITKTDASDVYRSVDLSKYPNGYTIQSTVVPDDPGSVRFFVNDVEFGVDNTPPFTLCGKDDDFENGFLDCNLPVGITKIKSTPFSKGNGNGFALPSREISIHVIDPSSVKGLSTITLYDISKGQDVKTLVTGSLINVALYEGGFTIFANVVDSDIVKSVKFFVNDQLFHTDSTFPFAACKESEGGKQPLPCNFENGKSYEIKVVPFSGTDGSGTELDGDTINVTIDNLILGVVTVVDMNSGESAGPLKEGGEIDKASFEEGNFNLQLDAPPETGEIKFYVNEVFSHSAFTSPFYACNDISQSKGGDPIVRCFFGEEGYSLRAVGFLKNKAGEPFYERTLNFKVTSSKVVEGVQGFNIVSPNGTVLGDASSDEPIETTNEEFNSINFVPVIAPAVVGSVGVSINTTFSHYANSPPYPVCVDETGLPAPCSFPEGDVLIDCTPYSKPDGQGKALPSLSLTVTIVPLIAFSGINSIALIDTALNTVVGILNGDVALKPNDNNVLVSGTDDVKSVSFIIDNVLLRVDNSKPFTMCPSKNSSKYESCNEALASFAQGKHTLSIRAYSGQGATGALLDSSSQDLLIDSKEFEGDPSTPEESGSGGGLGMGVIIGVVLGAVFLILLVVLVVLYRRSKNKKNEKKEHAPKRSVDLEMDNTAPSSSAYEELTHSISGMKPSSVYDPSDPEWIRYYANMSLVSGPKERNPPPLIPSTTTEAKSPVSANMGGEGKCKSYYHPGETVADPFDDQSYLTATEIVNESANASVYPTSSIAPGSEHYSNYDNANVITKEVDLACGAESKTSEVNDPAYDDPTVLCASSSTGDN